MDSRAIRDARQGSVLAPLINRAKFTWGHPNWPVEHWFRTVQFALGEIREGLAPTQTGGPPCEYAFSECASVLHVTRMVLPKHPDYPVFVADPLVRTEVDAVTKELFARLKVAKRKLLKRVPIRDANQIFEDEEAWSGFIRDLQLEDETETAAREETHSPPEGSNPAGISLASHSVHPALASTASQTEPGVIPDAPPSPRSYWIDLYPVEDVGHGHGCISEEPPVPLSHWIDLRPIEDYRGLVPEVAPEPTSAFLDLHPVIGSSVPEAPPSPADLRLKLHQAQNH